VNEDLYLDRICSDGDAYTTAHEACSRDDVQTHRMNERLLWLKHYNNIYARGRWVPQSLLCLASDSFLHGLSNASLTIYTVSTRSGSSPFVSPSNDPSSMHSETTYANDDEIKKTGRRALRISIGGSGSFSGEILVLV